MLKGEALRGRAISDKNTEGAHQTPGAPHQGALRNWPPLLLLLARKAKSETPRDAKKRGVQATSKKSERDIERERLGT